VSKLVIIRHKILVKFRKNLRFQPVWVFFSTYIDNFFSPALVKGRICGARSGSGTPVFLVRGSGSGSETNNFRSGTLSQKQIYLYRALRVKTSICLHPSAMQLCTYGTMYCTSYLNNFMGLVHYHIPLVSVHHS